MQELIAELTRLYLLDEQQSGGQSLTPVMLDQQLRGAATHPLQVISKAGLSRAVVLHFDGAQAGHGEQQWEALCGVANAVQHQLALPAPAVSISGLDGYALWLSLANPVPAVQVRRFSALLRAVYAPDALSTTDAPEGTDETELLPPCLNSASGKWAAFIHPGMGASFADEPRLEMAPPLAAQAGFLASLSSITTTQFEQALKTLEHSHGGATQAATPVPVPPPQGLLLKDASLDDIVQFLHQKNIEPTFRYLIDKST